MPHPPAGDARAPRLGQPRPVPLPLQNQECPAQGAGPLARAPWHPPLLLLVATRGDQERVLGITPTHLYGAATVPRPPSGRMRRRTGYTPSCEHRTSPPLRGST